MNKETSTMLHQYLTFNLGAELFALDISFVREILDDKNITTIPNMPDYLRGVLNVRGHPVPVVDLRLKFGMSKTEITTDTCVIITEVETDEGSVVMGALADSVEEVIELQPEAVDPPPRMGTAVDTQFIKGMGKQDDRFIIILNIDRVFTSGELDKVRSVDLSDSQHSEQPETASL